MSATQTNQPNEKMVYRLWPEAGQLLGLGRSATYRAARAGQIPNVKIGKLRLVPRAALEQMLGSVLRPTQDAR